MAPVSSENARSAFNKMNLSTIWTDEERPYAGLPDELRPFHYFFADMGHVIMAVLRMYDDKKMLDPKRTEVAIPVKTFLKSEWSRDEDGDYLVTNVEWDNVLGILYDEADIEFE